MADAFSTISAGILADGPEVDARIDSLLNHSLDFHSYTLPDDNWVRPSPPAISNTHELGSQAEDGYVG